MKILIDADGCPVIKQSIDISKKYDIEIVIIHDTSHSFDKYDVEKIVVPKGMDSVDFALVNKVQRGDIVITQDYGLAAMVLSKGGYPINQNGRIYDENNIDELLFSRHVAKKIRNSGNKLKSIKKRSKDDDIKFKEMLDKLIKDII